MFAEIFKSSSWVKGPEFLNTEPLLFERSTKVVKKRTGFSIQVNDKTKLPLVTDNYKIILQLIPIDNFSFFQKLLQITAYSLWLTPSHECYRKADCSIMDTFQHDGAKHHLQYLAQGF